MDIVRLKNGAEEAESLVVVTMISLDHLIATDVIAFYELVQLCKNPQHKLSGNTGDTLRGLNLVRRDEGIHDSIRNIVLSATSGDGLDMALGSPI